MFFSNPLTVVFVPDHSCNAVSDNTILSYRRIQDFLEVFDCDEKKFLSKFQNNQSLDCIFPIEKLRKLGLLSNPYKRGGLSIVRLY